MEVSWLPVDSDERQSGRIDLDFSGGTAWADEHARADDLGVFVMGALIDEILERRNEWVVRLREGSAGESAVREALAALDGALEVRAGRRSLADLLRERRDAR